MRRRKQLFKKSGRIGEKKEGRDHFLEGEVMAKSETFSHRTLRFSFRKNAIYDRRGASRALSDLWWRGDSGSCCMGEDEPMEARRKRKYSGLVDFIYLYYDFWVLKRPE
jgi:hypothetical protein